MIRISIDHLRRDFDHVSSHGKVQGSILILDEGIYPKLRIIGISALRTLFFLTPQFL